jgi:anti-sigma factor RsiW
MTCTRALEGDRAERYLDGELSAEEQAAFEDHYFECDECLRAVQALQTLPGAVARATRPRRGHRARYPAAAAAAVLAVSAFGLVLLRGRSGTMSNGPSLPTPASSPTTNASPASRAQLASLADLEPPLYVPLLLRGQDGRRDAHFDRAMARYAQNDYRGAAQGLRELVRGPDAATELLFFLGVSELAAGDTETALSTLGSCAARGASPHEAAARYYLAQAHMVKSDPEAARAELRAVERLGGAYLERARRALRRLDEAAASEP